VDGTGTPGRATLPPIPDFTNPTWQKSRSNVQLMISILEGKDRLMPANRGLVNDELARELVKYIRTFAASAAPSPAVAASPPPATPASPGKPGASSATAALPDFVLTGDFETDVDGLTRQLDDIHRRMKELELVAAKPNASPASPPPPPAAAVPAAGTSLADRPPVTAPEVTASSGNPSESGPAKSRIAAVPVSDRPFTADDVARGRELFLGRRSLVNGGPACVACHAVNLSEAREGSRLGPQLTKSYERLGGRAALSAHLWSPPTPTMRSAYLGRGLESDEVLALTAYLEDADRQAAEDPSPLPTKFLLLGLGGAVLGLGTLSFLWGHRSRRREPSTASQADCVGAGL
jgi:mono/diheme cytochrome c family protein